MSLFWLEFPSELRHAILQRLSLPQLRLLKSVSHRMAHDCRAVLRSEAWQEVPLNMVMLETELKTQLNAYKLPLTVSIYTEFFPPEAPCIATVHRLKLTRVNHDEITSDVSPAAWTTRWGPETGDSTFTSITDMCIEIHGVGICGSEVSLRIALQEELRRRGKDPPPMTSTSPARSLWPYKIELHADGWSLMRDGNGINDVKLDHLLGHMEVVTEVRKGVWWRHEKPHSGENGFDYCGELSLLDLCRLGSKILLA